MNWGDVGQHKQPHFHAFYNDYEAVFGLDGKIIAGKFPDKQTAFVKAWVLIHESEIVDNWNRAVNKEETYRIDPLR